MPDTRERRRFWRANFHVSASLLTDNEESAVQIEDLSLKGALFTLPENVQVANGENCRLQISLADGVLITLWGRVAHTAGRSVGIKCDSVDLDSLTHLRRLVELNAGDPALLEEEISFLVSSQGAV